MFSVSEAGAKANAICLSLAETAKANGIDFYSYLAKLLTELPNLPIHRQPELLREYLPWSDTIQATCTNSPLSEKNHDIRAIRQAYRKGALIFYISGFKK